ncbi:MAG: ComF family protein [Desulforhopalus sp.]|nr:ComF family protein [Desulforhopalus sp.]
MNILFPPVCGACRIRLDAHQSQNLCPECTAGIRYSCQPLCRICGMELAGPEERTHLCGRCLRMPPPYTIARSLVRYEPVVQKLVQRLKYAGDTSVVSGITDIVANCDLSEFADCQWILPVPLHLDRHRYRGLNQATILAGLFFPGKRQLIRMDWLVRTRNTPAQTLLGGAERRKNLVGAFQLRAGNRLAGTAVCLVDDVFTTGTTVEECARVLMSEGAREVRVLTLARVVVLQRGGMR